MSPRADALPQTERRDQIVDAALPLLREHGRQVTTRQIADAAGIAEGTIFRAFASKEEIIEAALARLADASVLGERILAIDPTRSLEERIGAIWQILLHRHEEVLALVFALGPPNAGKGEAADQHRRRHADYQRLVVEAAGQVLDADRRRLAVDIRSLMLLINALAMQAAHPMLRESALRDQATVVDLVLHGALVGGRS